MTINILQLPPLDANCILLSDESNNLAIVDPVGGAEKVTQYIERGKFLPRMILLTHGHFDHIGAAYELHAKYNIPISVHKSDEYLLQLGPVSAQYYGLPEFPIPMADNYLEDGQEIQLGEGRIKVLHTPGHSPGSVCFHLPVSNAVLTGDTLFREGIGRTDFPGSSSSAILNSIKLKLYSLSDDTRVYPGHGPDTSIGYEKGHNPYVRLGR